MKKRPFPWLVLLLLVGSALGFWAAPAYFGTPVVDVEVGSGQFGSGQ